MSNHVVIAIDTVSGDHGIEVTIPAAFKILSKYDDIDLILVGNETALRNHLAQHGDTSTKHRLQIIHATQHIEMNEKPAQALRMKPDSSMYVTINQVKEKRATACVSAGNTGALVGISRYVLNTLPSIRRPAITAMIPNLRGHVHILDLGANVDCNAEDLFQFAVMGTVLAEIVDNIENPRIALLNIGQEANKGNDQVKSANHLLQNSELHYIGYIEGNQIYTSDADVIIADGFVGNVALKSMEGTASFIGDLLKQSFNDSYLARVAKLAAAPILKKVKKIIDPGQYNGASLLGLRGIVIKSHGNADAIAFARAIEIARIEALKQIPNLLDIKLNKILSYSQSSAE